MSREEVILAKHRELVTRLVNSDDEVGRMVKAANAAQQESYTYDALDHVLSATNVGLGKTVSYEYDAAGNQIKTIDPEGLVITNTYDEQDQLKSVTDLYV